MMRPTFTRIGYFNKMSDFEDVMEKYEEQESIQLNELHQILILDTGRADIANEIEKMNFNIAKA